MASKAIPSDWVRNERRRQNAAVLVIILSCLVVAFFPRNERGLFTFPGFSISAGMIAAPVQTDLRSPIFGTRPNFGKGPTSRVLPEMRSRPVFASLFGPDVAPLLLDDPWRDGLLTDNPLQFDLQLPDPADLIGPTVGPQVPPTGPRYPGQIGEFRFMGGVPEPGTWAMMILGIGAVAYRLRAVRGKALRLRAHARWRRNLVPASGPIFNFAPAPAFVAPAFKAPERDDMASVMDFLGGARCRNIGGFGMGANQLAYCPAPARK